jgi:hypothetical protein
MDEQAKKEVPRVPDKRRLTGGTHVAEQAVSKTDQASAAEKRSVLEGVIEK